LTRPGEQLTALSCTHQGSLGNSARVEAEKKGVKHAQAGSILILKKKNSEGSALAVCQPGSTHALPPSQFLVIALSTLATALRDCPRDFIFLPFFFTLCFELVSQIRANHFFFLSIRFPDSSYRFIILNKNKRNANA
jgi:hypothetical protein